MGSKFGILKAWSIFSACVACRIVSMCSSSGGACSGTVLESLKGTGP